MGDLGSDAGSSALSLGSKVMEAILNLFNKAFEAWKTRPERELAKYKIKDAKSEAERLKIAERLQGIKGYVNYQDLKRSGKELESTGVFMTKDEMRAFSAICKREGILFSGMTDQTSINQEGVKTYDLICEKGDMPKLQRVIDRLNDEKMIAGIENEISKLEAKGDSMTDYDKSLVDAYKEQIAAIKKEYCLKLNDEMSDSIIDAAVTGKPQ